MKKNVISDNLLKNYPSTSVSSQSSKRNNTDFNKEIEKERKKNGNLHDRILGSVWFSSHITVLKTVF